MTWTRVQEEFEPRGRNKLVKRSEKSSDETHTPYRKIGKHKLVLQKPSKTVVVPVPVIRHRANHIPPKVSLHHPEFCKAISESGTSQTLSTVLLLPRKLGRHKLVFTPVSTPTTIRPPEMNIGSSISPNPTLLDPKHSRKEEKSHNNNTNHESSSTNPKVATAAVAAATTNLKHLRANYKSTKSGLKRVEPPVCKFFQQQGMCFDDHCPYRHVKIGRLGKRT